MKLFTTFQWNDSFQNPKTVVEQIVDTREPPVMEKIVKVPKITQYRHSAEREYFKTASSSESLSKL